MNQIEAYWLGFLYADGTLRKPDKRRQKSFRRICLELSSKDRDHIDLFLMDFDPSRHHNIRYKKRRNKTNEAAITTISINKLKFISENNWDLFHVGNSAVLDALSNIEFIHWLRGFIDGDGSIKFKRINKRRPLTPTLVIFSPHQAILAYIGRRINEIINISSNTVKKHVNIYKINWSGTRARDILRYVYNNAKRWLDRKYKDFLICNNFISIFEKVGDLS